MASNRIYDALILGGGPAGLSVALGLGRQNRPCLVISHNVFRNDGIEASHAVLGHDHIHPQMIWARGREQIERYGNTDYVEAEIVAAERVKMPQWRNRDGYLLRSCDGRTWTGKTLVLAAGVRDVFPSLEGYKQNWPRNIYQCLFCDGWERRQRQKAILCLDGVSMKDASFASMALGQHTDRDLEGNASVTILSNGSISNKNVEDAVARKVKALQARGVRIEQRRVVKLEDATPDQEGIYVHLENESGDIERRLYGFLVHKPPTELNIPSIIDQLGVVTEPGIFGPHIRVAAMTAATNVPGIFAAGDCGDLLTHVTAAMVSGVSAAGGVAHYLNSKDDDEALEDVDNQIVTKDTLTNGTGCGTV